MALQELGFRPDQSGTEWSGALSLPENVCDLVIRVCLPNAFPDTLPEVFVNRGSLSRRVAHVEKSGKVCLAPSATLLDSDRPGDLVREALGRAASTLERGLAGESDADLIGEFLAYWEPDSRDQLVFVARANGPARRLFRSRVSGVAQRLGGVLVTETDADARRWALNVGGSSTRLGELAFIPLSTAFNPPDFGVRLTALEARTLIAAHCSNDSKSYMESFLRASHLPATILLSLPTVVARGGRVLTAVRFEAASGSAAKAAKRGFRPGRVPSVRELEFSRTKPITRLSVERLDREYLLARGGAEETLESSTVAVIGVGAVGSEVALNLAAMGVGRLRLVDPDLMAAENVHRHVLGVKHLGETKTTAVSSELASRFPHLSFESREQRIEEVLSEDADFAMSADLVIVALGDETLERRLNRMLREGPPRIHAWVEPLGIGGHAILTRPGRIGCLECLYAIHATLGLHNRASLTAPGQDISRSLAGCAGTFSPFSALDARRIALEAAELGVKALKKPLDAGVLVTWRGDRDEFEEQGFRLSDRGSVVPPGGRLVTPSSEFARANCSVCAEIQQKPRVIPE